MARDLELRLANNRATSLPGDSETEYVTQQYNKRYRMSTFEKIEIIVHYLTDELTSFPMIPNS